MRIRKMKHIRKMLVRKREWNSDGDGLLLSFAYQNKKTRTRN